MNSAAILADLARVKVVFQLRAIAAVIGQPLDHSPDSITDTDRLVGGVHGPSISAGGAHDHG